MSKITLYHGRPVQGVHVVLTEEAYEAWEARIEYFRTHEGSLEGFDPIYIHRQVIGTMTFVSAGRYIRPEAVVQHYGTTEMMTALFKRCNIVQVGPGVYVPFSSVAAISEIELTQGYGYNAKRWVRLLKQVHGT